MLCEFRAGLRLSRVDKRKIRRAERRHWAHARALRSSLQTARPIRQADAGERTTLDAL